MIEAFGGRNSVQKGIFGKVSSMEDGKNDVQQSICVPGGIEFGTEASFEHTLVPHKASFPGRSSKISGKMSKKSQK